METDSLSLTFSALADPTRRAILSQIGRGGASVNDIVARHGLSQPAISKHIKVLEAAGLVRRSRIARSRPVLPDPEGFRRAAGWIEEWRGWWEGAFDKMDDLLAEMTAASGKGDENANEY